MPKIEQSYRPPARRRRQAAPPPPQPRSHEDEVRASSVVFGILILAALVVAAAAWMGGSLSQVQRHVDNTTDGVARGMGFSVNQIAVVGVDEDLARLVRDAAMVEPGENMFRADPHIIRRRVESTRQVLDVKVHRLWPDQILIIAAPARPTAVWNDGRGLAVVDSFGRLMPGVRAVDHPGLLRVTGDEAAPAAPMLAGALAGEPHFAERVMSAERVRAERWDLMLDTGARVQLPDGQRLAPAIARLADLDMRERVLKRPIRIFDLRTPGRVFITPAGDASEPVVLAARGN
ncbi:MAG: cell division protein FtsQ/DivIB [Pseudomonadota bacterium]